LNDEAQISGGLYGPLIVLEPGKNFNPNRDFTFVVSRAGRKGLQGPLFLNGASMLPALQWRKGVKYRLRLIDIANSNTGEFSLLGPDGPLEWCTVAKDGADLPSVLSVMKAATQEVFPGEIYDLEFVPREKGSLRLELPNSAVKSKVTQPIEVH
jgi:hypothetical protein